MIKLNSTTGMTLYFLVCTSFLGIVNIRVTLLFLLICYFIFSKKRTCVYRQKWIYVGLLIALIFNLLSCYFYRDQGFFNTIKGAPAILFLVNYFVLKKQNVSILVLEKSFLIISVIACCVLITQVLLFPKVIFLPELMDVAEKYTSEVPGFVRPRLNGQAFIFLGLSFLLSRFFDRKAKTNLISVVLCVLHIVAIFFLGFRTHIIGVVIIFAFMILISEMKKILKLRLFVVAIALTLCILMIPEVNSIITMMLLKNESQTFSNPDYIRNVQFFFFENNFFNSTLERILGAGSPHGSSYARYMESFQESGIFYVDWGIYGMSWILGIPFVSLVVYYLISGFVLKVPFRFSYCKAFFLFLVVTAVTTNEVFRNGSFLVQTTVLYILDIVNRNKK